MFISIFNFFIELVYVIHEVMVKYNQCIYPEYWYDEPELIECVLNEEPIKKVETEKYEDKYLNSIRKLSKEWIFTEEECNERDRLSTIIFNKMKNELGDNLKEINTKLDQIKKEMDEDTNAIKTEITELSDMYETTLEERNQIRKDDMEELSIELINKTNELNDENSIRLNAFNEATDTIINNRLEKLKNCHVMEYTPQGNVLMLYDKDKGSFKYYADKNIPYRFLEVVGRKYVKNFNCRPLFVDMEEELKLFEEKWTKEYELKKQKELEKKLKEEEYIKMNKQVPIKKNVFAKFKSYNKDAGGKISMAPPKNSIPKTTAETKEDEKIILKDRANRYTYEGKLANFNFLQKVERKVFDKKLALSFADFKKMNKK